MCKHWQYKEFYSWWEFFRLNPMHKSTATFFNLLLQVEDGLQYLNPRIIDTFLNFEWYRAGTNSDGVEWYNKFLLSGLLSAHTSYVDATITILIRALSVKGYRGYEEGQCIVVNGQKFATKDLLKQKCLSILKSY